MAWGLLLALCGALLAPAAAGGRHSLSVLVTAVINEDRTHHFTMITKVDDVQIAYYRSDTREVRATQEWAEQAVGAEFFQKKTQEFQTYEEVSKGGIRSWMQLHNETGGIHTAQLHMGCSLSDQAPVDPRFQYAYDGRDFISFDNQTGTWVAAVQPAFLQKQLWESADKAWTQYVQWWLQSECPETLQRLVQHGSGVLEQQGHHSLAVLVTAVINEDGTHHLITITQLDDVKITYYSSDTRELRITEEWVAQVLDAEYIQEKTQKFLGFEEGSKGDIRRWMQLHNQTGGIHTQQLHKSCALSGQAPMDPSFQFAYDGGDFISFDNQTGTWFPAVQVAFVQKQRWEADKTWTQHVQSWLQYECPRRLQRLLQSGGKILEQQVPPEVSVSRRDAPDGSVTLSCHARGFYPRPIHVSWVRDGEDILAETDSSGILPNADGTYYTQSSLEISPQQEDGHRYACRVEHSSLPEPVLVWAPGKKGPLPPGVLAAIVLAVLVLAGAVGAGVILWRRKSAGPMKPGYAPAATKSGEDSASSSSSGTDPRSVGPPS